jgi:hypothetical protein
MRIFKSKRFGRFTAREGIDDSKLREAVREAEAGKVDADYGGGVIKQRIARLGEGKSGGYRSVILYRRGEKAFFVYGFPKSERANIDQLEIRAFKDLAKITLGFSDQALKLLVARGEYMEVKNDDKS